MGDSVDDLHVLCRANRGFADSNDHVRIGSDAGRANLVVTGDLAARDPAPAAAHDLAPPDAPLAPQECTDNEHD
jgi:hypothetical protein